MIENIFKYLNKEDIFFPATVEQIELAQEKIGAILPTQYVEFLLRSNGYEGSVGEPYLAMWKIEDLDRFNGGYGVNEFTPHLILIGSNGGGEAYAFDKKRINFQ